MTAPYVAVVRPQERCQTLLDAAVTGGAFGLCSLVLRDRDASPLHVHRAEEETVYVLEGRCAFQIGGRRLEAGPGTVVHAPRDVPHRLAAVGRAARVLVLYTPGGFERVLAAVARTAEPDGGLLLALAREHRCEIFTPPL
jgi:quercetin dioxygenase-like cupin family protein